MKVLSIVGATTDDERTALREALAIWERGGACSRELLGRLPKKRVEVHVSSNTDANHRAIVVIEDGVVGFHPLDDAESWTVH